MTFNEFVNIMYEVIGNNTKADFVVDLLDMFTTYDEKEQGSYHDLDRSSLRKIFSGKRNINSLKSELIDHLDEAKFENIIEDYTEEKKKIIVEVFEQYGEKLDLNNLEENLYQLFISSLNATASKQPFISEELKRIFISEANGKCEIASCLNSTIDKNGKIQGKALRINDKFSYNYENLLFVCESCFKRYYNYRSGDTKKLLANSKFEIQKQKYLNSIIDDQKVEDGVDIILRRIANVTSAEIELNYKPLAIANKINDDEFLLKKKITMYITNYYTIIDNKIREAVILNDFNFTAFECKIKILFTKLDKERYSQTIVFNQLVRWLEEQAKVELEPCEALISYFVQKCEVFYDITK